MGIETSFNFEEYRDNLAEELREERHENGEEAGREKLKEAQKTPEYQVSRYLKLIKRELKNYPNSTLEQEPSEIETFDISDQIPDALKLCMDLHRIGAVETKLGKNFALEYEDRRVGDRGFPKIKGLKESLINELKRRKITNVDWKKETINRLETRLANDVVDGLTNKAFSNKKNLNHVLFGFGHRTPLYEPRLDSLINKNETLFNATQHGLNFDIDSKIMGWLSSDETLEDKKNRYWNIVNKDPETLEKQHTTWVWFTQGGNRSIYCHADSIVLTVSSQNKRLKQFTRQEPLHDPGEVIYKGIPYGTPWLEIADYIVDLPGKRMYKVTEPKEKSTKVKSPVKRKSI